MLDMLQRVSDTGGGMVHYEASSGASRAAVAAVSAQHAPTRAGVTELRKLLVLPSRRPTQTSNSSPVDLYLNRLMAGPSRNGCRYVLQEIAPHLGGATLAEVDWQAIGYPQAVAMLTALEAKGLSPASRKKARVCLRGVLKECWRLGLISSDQLARATDTATPKGEALPAGRALTYEECAALWRVVLVDTSVVGRRNAALLALLYATGLRRNELVRVELRDYDRLTGTLRIRHGKGGRQREALVADAEMRAVIDTWLALRGDEPGYLLLAIVNGRITPRAQPMVGGRIWEIVGELCHQAGIQRASPHDLRRTLCTDAARQFPLHVVRDLIGHQHITTTERYVRAIAGPVQAAAATRTIPR